VTLRSFVRTLAELGLSDDAAILHAAALTPNSGPAPYGADSVLMQETADALLDRLGREKLEARSAEGRALSDDDVVTVALQAIARARGLVDKPNRPSRDT
jgi:hypothetical protein